MANIRADSQQDRRVYVGNLSYDVKWHHLKDFMRQGRFALEIEDEQVADKFSQLAKSSSLTFFYFRME